MPLHLGLAHSHNQQQEVARQARRELHSKVRNDWTYPTAPHPNTHTQANHVNVGAGNENNGTPDTHSTADARAIIAAHLTSDTSGAPLKPQLDFEPTAWRGREYSDNETTTSGDEEEPTRTTIASTTSSLFRPKPKRKADVSESAESMADRKQARKRRRQERFEEEMTWNIGLAHFSAQRNAWTCACKPPSRPSTSSTISHDRSHKQDQEEQQEDGVSADAMDVDAYRPQSHPSLRDLTLALAEDATVTLPLTPRLLPTHPVRARITPSSYGEIYSKIIVQGRTPTVPINLQDITNSLVHGWKEEGNWPPKIAGVADGGKKKTSAIDGADQGTAHGKHGGLKGGFKVIGKVFHGLTGGPIDPTKSKILDPKLA